MPISDESEVNDLTKKSLRTTRCQSASVCHDQGLKRSTLVISTGLSGTIWTLLFYLLNFNQLAFLAAGFTIFTVLLLCASLALHAQRLRAGLKTKGEHQPP